MSKQQGPLVAIVDYGMGNLSSVQQACEHVGLRVIISDSTQVVKNADSVILPGVGAYRDAMESLTRLGMVDALQEAAQSNKPLMGICLGMQLLLNQSHEFGLHEGLGIVNGDVVRLDASNGDDGIFKVPQVGWNPIRPAATVENGASREAQWQEPLFNGLSAEEPMYFVHSYYAIPSEVNGIVSVTRYGNLEFCSSFRYGNVFACQFHPERSGPAGLRIYRNLAESLQELPQTSGAN